MVLVTPHCTLSCRQTSELPYEITGLLCTEKSRSEQERMEEKRRRSMIFLPRSGLQAGWSEGDRWTYQKVTRVWVSPRITSWYFSSTTRPPHHHLSPSSRTPRLAPSQFQTGQLDYWTIETLFLTLDHSPPTSHLPPPTSHLGSEMSNSSIQNNITLLTDLSATPIKHSHTTNNWA